MSYYAAQIQAAHGAEMTEMKSECDRLRRLADKNEAAADALWAERDLLREGHRLIKGFAEHIRDNAGNANLVRTRAGNIIRWIEINAALQEAEQ